MISVYEHTLQNPRRINYSWWRKATPYGTRPGRGQSVNIIIMIVLRKEGARFLRDGWAELGLYREERRKKRWKVEPCRWFPGMGGGGGGGGSISLRSKIVNGETVKLKWVNVKSGEK